VQNTELRQAELRPLGAGELLDRAVTLFVRDFVPIVTVLAVVIVPVVVLQALVAPKSGHVFTDLGRVFSAAGNRDATEAATAALARDGGSNVLQFLLTAISGVGRLLMWSAVISLIATAYAGSRATFGQAYRVGLQRWLPQLVVGLAFLVLAMIAAVPLLISYLLVTILIIALAGLHQTIAAVVLGVIGAVIVFGGFTVLLSWLFMMYELAAVAVVTETANPIEAIGIALRRGFARGMRVRTIVGGLVVFVVNYAGTLPVLAVALTLTALTHIDVLYFAVLGVGSVLLEGIVAAFVVVFAVDVRVRREGFDILAAEPPPVPQ
jgi:hypothetical protein